MSALVSTVNVVLPIGLSILIGILLRRFEILTELGTNALNKAAFYVLLPCMVFHNIYGRLDNPGVYLKLLLFCSLGYICAFVVALLIIHFVIRDVSKRGTMIQACLHNSYIIFGMSLLPGLYPGMECPGFSLVAGPAILFNQLASGIALRLYNKEGTGSVLDIIKEGLLKNPVFLGCILALVLNLTHLSLPAFLSTTIGNMSSAAVPICLIALGSSIKLRLTKKLGMLALFCVAYKIVILPLIMVPLGIYLGFRGEEMIAVLAIAGSPTAPVTYSLTASLGGDKELASYSILLSNCLSIVTFFGFICYMLQAGIL